MTAHGGLTSIDGGATARSLVRPAGRLRSVDTGRERVPDALEFVVLVGGDRAGDPSAFGALREDAHVLSFDQASLGPGQELIARLHRELDTRVLPGLGATYSPDFLAALLQTAVIHLRDRLTQVDDGRPVVVDSYYYKMLAQCRLSGVAENPMFDWWRTFPQPTRVFYLDIAPEKAWRRGYGCGLGPLSYHGSRPTRDGFVSYQKDLRELVFAELGSLDVRVLDGTADVADTVREVRAEFLRR
jgi:thymidylate kinase